MIDYAEGSGKQYHIGVQRDRLLSGQGRSLGLLLSGKIRKRCVSCGRAAR